MIHPRSFMEKLIKSSINTEEYTQGSFADMGENGG